MKARDEEAFAAEKAWQLRVDSKEGRQAGVSVYYFDAAGFSLKPVVPYAWQAVGKTVRIPSSNGKRLNVLGFYSKTEKSFFQTVEGSVSSQSVTDAIDAFVAQQPADDTRWRIIVMDNAPIHRSAAFRARMDDWLTRRVCIRYLPSYSPELNAIETLWRFIKYQWLPITAYAGFDSLKKAVLNILDAIGSKYKITFA